MPAQANLLSPAITSLNALPAIRKTAGRGGSSWLRSINDTMAALTTGATAGGILRVLRIPSDANVKEVYWKVDATVTTADVDIGLYYSNAPDGTTPPNVLAADTPIDADFFASALDVKTASALGWTPCTFEGGFYSGAEVNMPIWQAVGLSEDPGGYFDICMTTTSTLSGAPILSMRCDYTMPA